MKMFRNRHALLAVPAIALVLSGCGGGGSDMAAIDPDVPPPPPPPAPTSVTVTLRGQIVDQPIANATVMVSVGDQTFMSTANVDGMYEVVVTMPVGETAGFVSLTATGNGAQASAGLSSLLGSFGTLMTQSGGDGVLDRGDNANTNVTNLTTAETVLAIAANGGTPPTTDAALADALTAVDPVQALNIAAAIKLVIDNGVPLPAGSTNTLDLASDTTAVNAFIADQQANNAVAFQAAVDATVANPAIVATPTAASIPAFAYAIVSATTQPQTLFGGAANGSLAFQYNTDGTGAFWTSNGYSNAMRWTLADGDIVSTFTSNPAFGFTTFPIDPATGQQIRIVCTTETSEVRVRRLTGTSANVTQTGVTTCDDARFNESGTSTQTLLFAETSQLDSLTAADVAGNTFTLTIYEPTFDNGQPGFEPMASDIVTFNADGTGSTRLRNRTLTWAITGSSLVATYSNGVVATYTLVRSFADNGGLVLSDFARADGERRVAGSITWDVDVAEPVPAAGEVPGVYYQYGVGTTSNEGTDSRLKGFALEFRVDGRISHRTDRINDSDQRVTTGGGVNAFFRSWTLSGDGAIRVDEQFNTTTGFSDAVGCPTGTTAANCILLDRRDIFVVNGSDDGRIVYVLERRVTDFANGVSASSPTTYFARFYETAANGDYELARSEPTTPVRMPAPSALAPASKPLAR